MKADTGKGHLFLAGCGPGERVSPAKAGMLCWRVGINGREVAYGKVTRYEFSCFAGVAKRLTCLLETKRTLLAAHNWTVR